MAKSKLSRDEAEEYTKNLGQSVLGDYGLMEFAMHTLQVPKALGYETNEEWVYERLGGFIRQTEAQRQDAVEQLSGQRSEGGRYEKTSTEVAEILGISEATVKRDRSMVEAKASRDTKKKPAALPEGSRDTLNADARRKEVAAMVDAGWSNAQIAVELSVSVTTIQKDRQILRKANEKPSKQLKEAQAKKKANAPSLADQKANEAEFDKRYREPTMKAFAQMRSPDAFILSAIEETRWFIEEGAAMPNYDECLAHLRDLLNEFIVYGAMHGIDVSELQRMIERS